MTSTTFDARCKHLLKTLSCFGWTFCSLFLAGCLSKPALTRHSFAFPLPNISTNKFNPNGQVLQIQQIRVAATYDSQSFVYRTGAFAYEVDPYAQFLVMPEQAFYNPMRAYFLDSGLYREVGNWDSSIKPDVVASVFIAALYGDFRDRNAPSAVLRMNFKFNREEPNAQNSLLLHKEYEQQTPFKERTAAALMKAWNVDLQSILSSVTSDLAQLNNNSSNAPAQAPTGRQ